MVADNDHSAFERIVVMHQSNLRQFLRRLTGGDYALADDIAQDSFLIAYQQISSFAGKGSFGAWLRRIAYRRFLRVIEKSSFKNEQTCDTSWNLLITQDTVQGDLHAEQLLSKLSIQERTALTMNISEGMTHQEISDLTQWPLGTVKSHINRAKNQLETILTKQIEVA